MPSQASRQQVEPRVHVDSRGAVAVVEIRREEVANAVDPATLGDLNEALRDAARDDDVAVIVLTGAGRSFSTGLDIKVARELSSGDFEAAVEAFQQLTRMIRDLRKPVIAAIDGYAYGGGLELAAACDIRIVPERSRFSCPEPRWGLVITNGASAILPRILGEGRARLLALSGAEFDARWAQESGFAITVPAGEAVETAIAQGEQIAEQDKEALASTKELLNAANDAAVEAALEAEHEAIVALFQRPETKGRLEGFGTWRGGGAGRDPEPR